MALTLHNTQSLADHMQNEDSFMWITKQIYESNFDVDSYENKAAFLKEWHEIDETDKIYEKRNALKIYKAFKRDNSTNDYCVVKVYNNIQQKNKDEMRSIKETFLLMKKTNLLTFYGLYYDAQRECMLMTMEPLQQTLKDYVESYETKNGHKIQEIECKLIVSYLLYDLWILNKTGYIHCDINPSNIMLRDRREQETLNGWRLIDYGNRLFIGNQEYVSSAEVRGCICWTPPESSHYHETGKRRKIKRGDYNRFCYGTDIWSIGLIILYILCGEHVFALDAEEQSQCETTAMYMELFYNKLLKNDKYDMDSDRNKGEIWMRNYLIKLYVLDKISKELFDLLHDYILLFDPRKRANCKTIWFHPWFDEYRVLCKLMSDKMEC